MPSIDKRIAALEQKKAPTEQITIIRRIVWEAQESTEIKQLRDEHGASWSRGPSESEQSFIERVKNEAWRNEWGVMLLNGFVWDCFAVPYQNSSYLPIATIFKT